MGTMELYRDAERWELAKQGPDDNIESRLYMKEYRRRNGCTDDEHDLFPSYRQNSLVLGACKVKAADMERLARHLSVYKTAVVSAEGKEVKPVHDVGGLVYRGNNRVTRAISKVLYHIGFDYFLVIRPRYLLIPTDHGAVRAKTGDWIVRAVGGGLFVFTDIEFKMFFSLYRKEE